MLQLLLPGKLRFYIKFFLFLTLNKNKIPYEKQFFWKLIKGMVFISLFNKIYKTTNALL